MDAVLDLRAGWASTLPGATWPEPSLAGRPGRPPLITSTLHGSTVVQMQRAERCGWTLPQTLARWVHYAGHDQFICCRRWVRGSRFGIGRFRLAVGGASGVSKPERA